MECHAHQAQHRLAQAILALVLSAASHVGRYKTGANRSGESMGAGASVVNGSPIGVEVQGGPFGYTVDFGLYEQASSETSTQAPESAESRVEDSESTASEREN